MGVNITKAFFLLVLEIKLMTLHLLGGTYVTELKNNNPSTLGGKLGG